MKKTLQFGILTGFAAALLAPVGAVQAQDIEAGKAVFKKCQVCHTVEEGKNRVGPSLYGVIGRTAGTAEGYRFSSAMTAHGEEGNAWTEAALDEYLQAPRKVVPKTRMAFPGLKDAADRANVIAYLKSVPQ